MLCLRYLGFRGVEKVQIASKKVAVNLPWLLLINFPSLFRLCVCLFAGQTSMGMLWRRETKLKWKWWATTLKLDKVRDDQKTFAFAVFSRVFRFFFCFVKFHSKFFLITVSCDRCYNTTVLKLMYTSTLILLLLLLCLIYRQIRFSLGKVRAKPWSAQVNCFLWSTLMDSRLLWTAFVLASKKLFSKNTPTALSQLIKSEIAPLHSSFQLQSPPLGRAAELCVMRKNLLATQHQTEMQTDKVKLIEARALCEELKRKNRNLISEKGKKKSTSLAITHSVAWGRAALL